VTPLSLSEYAVLGLLADGPLSGYDLHKRAERTIGYFWRPAKSKIYELLPRLGERGLVDSRQVPQDRRPDKQVHELTPLGREALREWLESHDLPKTVARNPLLLRLFFGAHGDTAALLDLIAELKTRAEQQLGELRALENDVDPERDAFAFLTLLHGIEDAESTVRWCGVALEVLARHAAVSG
jgi:PadR family transcriptional regulator, regulatory protein AphA